MAISPTTMGLLLLLGGGLMYFHERRYYQNYNTWESSALMYLGVGMAMTGGVMLGLIFAHIPFDSPAVGRWGWILALGGFVAGAVTYLLFHPVREAGMVGLLALPAMGLVVLTFLLSLLATFAGVALLVVHYLPPVLT